MHLHDFATGFAPWIFGSWYEKGSELQKIPVNSSSRWHAFQPLGDDGQCLGNIPAPLHNTDRCQNQHKFIPVLSVTEVPACQFFVTTSHARK